MIVILNFLLNALEMKIPFEIFTPVRIYYGF